MSSFLIRLLVAVFVFFAAVPESSAQSEASAQVQENVAITKLFQPVYPPVAKQTRITGDVEITVEIRKDGSLESASVVSGHPFLEQAALDSTRRSQFECKNCGEGVRSFQMLYSFQLGPTRYCAEGPQTPKSDAKEETYPRVIESQNHVSVIDQPVGTCDLAIDRRKVRSAKCLYLWKCGLQ
jgi:TonB family protein